MRGIGGCALVIWQLSAWIGVSLFIGSAQAQPGMSTSPSQIRAALEQLARAYAADPPHDSRADRMLATPPIARLVAPPTIEGREQLLRAAAGGKPLIFPLLGAMPYYYERERRMDLAHAWRAVAIAYAESIYDESTADRTDENFEVRERLLADAEDLRAMNAEDEGALDVAIRHRQLEVDYLKAARSRRRSLGLSDYSKFDMLFHADGVGNDQHAYNQLARLYNMIGADELEAEADGEAYRVAKDSPDLINYCQARLHEARLADRKGSPSTALQIIRRAIGHVFVDGAQLAVREPKYTRPLDGMIELYKAGALYAVEAGQLQLGIKWIDRAIAWDRKRHANDQEFMNLVDKAMLLVGHGKTSEALQTVKELEAIYSRSSSASEDYIIMFHTAAARVLRAAAAATHDRALLDRAFDHDMVSVRYVRTKRGEAALTTSTRYFNVYQSAVETAWSLSRFDSSPDIAWQALDMAEQGSGQHLANLTAAAQRSLLMQLPELERMWIDSDRKSRDLFDARLARAQGDPDKESQAVKDYEAARRETADHFAELHREYPRIMSLIDPSGAKLGTGRFEPPPGTLVLRFFEGSSHVLGWALANGQIYFYQVGTLESVRALVSTFLSANNSPSEASRRRATMTLVRLYRLLVEPAERALKLNPRRLVVVPSGVLYQVPFEALVIGEQPRRPRFLIDQASVIYAPSLTVFDILQNGAQHKRLGPPRLLAFADPDYRTASVGSATLRSQVLKSIGLQLHPLPSARIEVDHIASLFASDQAQKFVGSDATLGNLRRERLGSYDFVHFAVHGLVPKEVKGLAQPVIALGGSPDDDGFVDPQDLVNLGLRSYLTVLSACSSGVGVLYRSEGNVAFSTILLSGGSDHVLASLWPVEDSTTSELMTSFYRRALAGRDLAEALRLAKLELLDRSVVVSLRRGVAGSYPSAVAGRAEDTRQRLPGDWPFLWSSFILFGAGTPVSFETPADAAPLGSKQAPVRCDGPSGEREYLDHLRCSDGGKVNYRRDGNIGVGAYGNVVDAYTLSCGDATSTVYMDMYFHGYIEKRAIANFKFR